MANQPGDHEAYARAILQGSATRKRQAATTSDARVSRVGKMAVIIDTAMSGIQRGFLTPYVSKVNERMASVAPPMRAYGSDGKSV